MRFFIFLNRKFLLKLFLVIWSILVSHMAHNRVRKEHLTTYAKRE